MRQILENKYYKYGVVNINENMTVLEYLMKYNFSFRLYQVDDADFMRMKNSRGILDLELSHPMVGYRRKLTETDFRTSRGLKISDPKGVIDGSFVIEGERIIYDISHPFYRERNSYVYGGTTYYTDMSMKDILVEELEKERDCLICTGGNLKTQELQIEELSKDELLEYVINPEKSKKILTKIPKTKIY